MQYIMIDVPMAVICQKRVSIYKKLAYTMIISTLNRSGDIKMKLEMNGIQKVGSVVFLVFVMLMLTTIIILHHQVQEADKLTKTEICMLWFNGIGRTVTISGLTFEQIIPEIERYNKECG
jgi:hypothetical protein